jgi:hypothetical protein
VEVPIARREHRASRSLLRSFKAPFDVEHEGVTPKKRGSGQRTAGQSNIVYKHRSKTGVKLRS